MKKNVMWFIITIVLGLALTLALFQIATSLMQSQVTVTRYDFISDDKSQTIGPIGPEADPYLEHYRGIVGSPPIVPTVDTSIH